MYVYDYVPFNFLSNIKNIFLCAKKINKIINKIINETK